MGVKGLWRLLLPIGRRISVETLEGRTLAIDASIWLTQFLKANRDPDTGTVRPGAHLIGFLRRICKLLYHGIRPVFVFDGATPEIKLREIRLRRERRERMTIGIGGTGPGGGEDDGAIKRMARKLLVSELKRRKELEAGNKKKSKAAAADTSSGAFSAGFNLGDEDDKDDNGGDNNSNSQKDQQKKDENDNEENGQGPIANLASTDIIDLSPLDNGAEYSRGGGQQEKYAQNDWDDAKPALFGSDDSSSSDGSASVQIPEDEEQLDIDAVLSLPADQRKDIVEKAKRQQRLRSRKEFMPAAADPEAYSQVQLKNFLRSGNLNKKINEMGAKAAKGAGVDGLEGEAIASDATRRFIFVKDKDKDEEKKGGNGANGSNGMSAGENNRLASPSGTGGHAHESPGRRHRLRRVNRHEDESDDDDDVFGGQFNNNAAQGAASAARDRAIYSSSDDDDGGGGFVVNDASYTSSRRGSSPDPKRKNYNSHEHHDAKGRTLDEHNVFDSNGDDKKDVSSDEGRGFLPEETPMLSLSEHKEPAEKNAQMQEDEMLARALQEAEEEDALSVGESHDTGGFVAENSQKVSAQSQGLLDYASHAGSSSILHQQEESDAILAAQLREEEQKRGNQAIDLSGEVNKEVKEQKQETGVLDNSDEDSDSEVIIRPPGKRRRGGVPAKPFVVKAPTDDSDEDVEWEDGDDADADNENEQSATSSPSAEAPQEEKEESAVDSEEDINWEDGNEQEEEEEVAVLSHASRGAKAKGAGRVDNNDESEERQLEPVEASEDDVAWEDGDADSIVKRGDLNDEEEESSRRNSSRRSSFSETDGEIDEDGPNDFAVSPAKDANIAALKHAEATAANLTNWAGRAVRRAIAAHMEESGTAKETVVTFAAVASAAPAPAVGASDEIAIDDSSSDEEEDKEVSKRSAADDAIEVESHGEEDVRRAEATIPHKSVRFSDSTTSTQPAAVSVSGNETPNVQTAAAPRPAGIANSSRLIDTSLEALQQEHNQMQAELNRQQRDMDMVTDEMKEEIMQLLQLFGIPYIEAPAEAEAQACVLEELGLVDGVVTEDSDAFVFGGKKVYKNIFDDQKYVEVYFASDAARDLGLSHNHMVALAMLLGGDYTEGVKGVGIVNGMEVLQAFDVSNDVNTGLSKFRQWLDGFEPTDAKVTRTPAEKEFHNKHRSARTRWVAPKDFPSPNVLNAYQKPVVDRSDASFSWGTPDIEALRTFCYRKIGWSTEETDRAILPVMKALENAGTRQTRLESYFMRYEDDIKFADVRSKRLKSVLNKVKSGGFEEATTDNNGEGENRNVAAAVKKDGKNSTAKSKGVGRKRKPRAASAKKSKKPKGEKDGKTDG